MEIMKIFSDSYDEERLYSVLLSEEEMIMFSEIQKEFALKDYAGLDLESAQELREDRSRLAKRLWEERKRIHALEENDKKLLDAVEKTGYFKDSDKNKIKNLEIDGKRYLIEDINSARNRDISNYYKSSLDSARFKAKLEASDDRRRAQDLTEIEKNYQNKRKLRFAEMEEMNSPTPKQNQAPVTTPQTSSPSISPSVSTTAEKATEGAKKGIGMLESTKKFIKSHKVGVGIGAAGLTTAAIGGTYLYNKNKKKINNT